MAMPSIDTLSFPGPTTLDMKSKLLEITSLCPNASTWTKMTDVHFNHHNSNSPAFASREVLHELMERHALSGSEVECRKASISLCSIPAHGNELVPSPPKLASQTFFRGIPTDPRDEERC